MRAAKLNELLGDLEMLIRRMKSGTDNDPGDTVLALAQLLGDVLVAIGESR